MTGAEIIAAERERQLTEEGWTVERDLDYKDGELVMAARGYALSGIRASDPPPIGWPWLPEWWKPNNNAVRNLAKAGALIAAEIDRINFERDKAFARAQKGEQ